MIQMAKAKSKKKKSNEPRDDGQHPTLANSIHNMAISAVRDMPEEISTSDLISVLVTIVFMYGMDEHREAFLHEFARCLLTAQKVRSSVH